MQSSSINSAAMPVVSRSRRLQAIVPKFTWLFPLTTMGLIVFIIVPPITLLSLSLSERFDLEYGILPVGFTTEMYTHWFGDILRAMLDSLLITLPALILCFAIGIPTAFALVRYDFPGKGLANELVTLPLIFPPIVLALGLFQLFRAAGISQFGPWPALILSHTIVSVPFLVRPVMAALEQVNTSIEEAAMSLGATRPRAFLTTVVPIILPAVVTGLALAFARSIADFELSFLLTTPEVRPMPVTIYQAFETGSARLGAAVAMTANLFALSTVLILEFTVRRLKWW